MYRGVMVMTLDSLYLPSPSFQETPKLKYAGAEPPAVGMTRSESALGALNGNGCRRM